MLGLSNETKLKLIRFLKNQVKSLIITIFWFKYFNIETIVLQFIHSKLIQTKPFQLSSENAHIPIHELL